MGWSSFRKTGLTYKDSRSAGGYTLVTPIGGDWVLLIDEMGRVIQRWEPAGVIDSTDTRGSIRRTLK